MRFAGDVLRGLPRESSKDQRSLVVIDLLAQVPGSPVLADLATHLNISVSRLEHIFKQGTGVSIRSFTITLRLHRAALLLADPGIPIKQVQYESFFNHASNFSHLFRRHFGCSASALRATKTAILEDPLQQETPTQCACDARLRSLVLLAMMASSRAIR